MDLAQDENVVELAGILFPDDRSVIRKKHRRLIKSGRYEQYEWHAMRALAGKGDRVLELGSGAGYLSTALAKHTQVDRIDTFEANPRIIPFIEKTHVLNSVEDRVTVNNALVTPEGGAQVPFYVRGDFLASSLQDNMGERHGGIIETCKVKQRKFSAVVSKLKPTLLLCDIEGGELDLLPNVDVSGFRGLVVELHPASIGLDGVKRIFDAMSEQNFVYDATYSVGQVVVFMRVDG